MNVKRAKIDWRKGKSCLVPAGPTNGHRQSQCEHGKTEGRYVVAHPTLGLCAFSPSTKLQALFWVGSQGDEAKELRREAVFWQCNRCGCTMPLGGA